MASKVSCPYHTHNQGHTYFRSDKEDWCFDTKGYTLDEDDPGSNKKLYGYYKPEIYPFALHNYFTEGAYLNIIEGEIPVITECTTSDCDMLTHPDHFSPMNLNDTDYMSPSIFTTDAQGNILDYGTVEFNSILFCKDGDPQNSPQCGTYQCSEKGEICNVAPAPRGTGYTRKQVLQRTVVHEMGHALLEASNDDHCKDPKCPMFEGVLDWKLYDFGSQNGCTHAMDIPKKIHNTVH